MNTILIAAICQKPPRP